MFLSTPVSSWYLSLSPAVSYTGDIVHFCTNNVAARDSRWWRRCCRVQGTDSSQTDTGGLQQPPGTGRKLMAKSIACGRISPSTCAYTPQMGWVQLWLSSPDGRRRRSMDSTGGALTHSVPWANLCPSAPGGLVQQLWDQEALGYAVCSPPLPEAWSSDWNRSCACHPTAPALSLRDPGAWLAP